jgi:penicillin amidase
MDPHLNSVAPSILYEARLDGGDLHCWGATFPGVPVLPFGANDKICWGPSDLPADSQDLYLEKLNPSNPREYEVDGKWVPFDVINEQIPSKAADGTIQPYLLDVLVSKHGPVVEYRPGEAVALRWTGSDPTDDFTSFFKVMRADSLAGFYEAFRDYSCPPQNYCVAEAGRRGKVGQVIAGHIPIRKGYDGTRPVDGSVSSNDWVGFIPYNQLPHRLNPPEHFVAHANNIPRGAMDQCKQTLGVSFSPNYRVNRIIERLLKDKPLTPEKMREIQMDDVDTTARFFVPAILGAWDREGSAYPGLAADVEMLRGWDYRLNESSVAATLYQVWLIELARGAIVDHLRQDSSTYLGYEDRWLPLLEAYLGGNGSLPWLDSDNRSARDKHVLDALQATIARLRNEIGVDPRSWAWGSVHSAVFPHPSGMAQLIGGGSHPWGGGRYTIRVGHYDLQSNLPFQNDFGTVFRAVAASSGGKWEITAVMPPGEGGSSLGPHFTDQMEMWLSGEQREVPFGKTELEPAYSIRLTPAGP